MTDRVALGALGSSTYGLRVSKAGLPPVSGTTLVNAANLLFDSVYPVSSFPIYKVYDVSVVRKTTAPGSFTVTHSSPALTYVPFALGFEKVTASNFRSDNWIETTLLGDPVMTPPNSDGFSWEITTSQLTVFNHNMNETRTFRIIIFAVSM